LVVRLQFAANGGRNGGVMWNFAACRKIPGGDQLRSCDRASGVRVMYSSCSGRWCKVMQATVRREVLMIIMHKEVFFHLKRPFLASSQVGDKKRGPLTTEQLQKRF